MVRVPELKKMFVLTAIVQSVLNYSSQSWRSCELIVF